MQYIDAKKRRQLLADDIRKRAAAVTKLILFEARPINCAAGVGDVTVSGIYTHIGRGLVE